MKRKPKPGPYKRAAMGYEFFTWSRWARVTFKRRGPGKRRNRAAWLPAAKRIALTDYVQSPHAPRKASPL